ncbi:hypothetical protein DFH06DRAFT_731560 [Mycena polygramma]|nr:hypothetical protein DFH06DRAFT_731560 [Mycena polygramma]
MLPFALKVAWLVLSLIGTFLSVLAFAAIGATVGCRWAPAGYCIGLVIQQGMFCLGIIWRMDPYSMPRAFCVAQAIGMSLGLYIIGGTCLAFCIAVCHQVLKPKQWGDVSRFQWRPIYFLPVIGIPFVASAVRIALVLKYDAVQPVDGLRCDASHHLFVRLAGDVLPTILMLPPAAYFSVVSARRVMRTLKHVERARRDENELPRQMRRDRHSEQHSFKPSRPSGISIPSSRLRPSDLTLPAKAETSSRLSFHLPFLRQLQSVTQALTPPPESPNPSPNPYDDGRTSSASTTFPTFATLTADDKPQPRNETGTETETETEIDGGAIPDVPRPWMDQDSCETPPSSNGTSEGHDTAVALELNVKRPDENDDDGVYRLSYRESCTTPSRISHLAYIPMSTPHIQRLLVYQLVFPITMALSTMLTIVEVLTHPEWPRPVGSRDVVQLMNAWICICVVFALQGVRAQVCDWLAFWRSR